MTRSALSCIAVTLAVTLVACTGPVLLFERGPMNGPVVERTGNSSVEIRWPQSFSSESVAIFGGVDPEQIDLSTPLAISNRRSVELTEKDDVEINVRRRVYFELVPVDGGDPVVVAERRLPLSCCDNFRDLGGYRTADGRRVRWNRLYRANDLSKLSRQDFEYLSQLEVNLVCDFRSDRERLRKPDRMIEATTPQLNLAVDQMGVDPTEIQEKIRTGGMVALGIERTMLDAYRAFVTQHSDQWAAMFERIAHEENLPTLVHCTAGKDRTGFASALVLLALGVPVETVFDDYLLTNYYRQNFMRFVLRWAPLYSLFRTDPDDLLPLLLAKREYLQASIDTMVENFGSIDGYLEVGLGLTPDKRAQLASLLLSPPR